MSQAGGVFRQCPTIICLQTTNAVFLGSPPPVGYGWGQFAIAGGYAIPIVRILSTGDVYLRYIGN
jgi:hypothetical protein